MPSPKIKRWVRHGPACSQSPRTSTEQRPRRKPSVINLNLNELELVRVLVIGNGNLINYVIIDQINCSTPQH